MDDLETMRRLRADVATPWLFRAAWTDLADRLGVSDARIIIRELDARRLLIVQPGTETVVLDLEPTDPVDPRFALSLALEDRASNAPDGRLVGDRAQLREWTGPEHDDEALGGMLDSLARWGRLRSVRLFPGRYEVWV